MGSQDHLRQAAVAAGEVEDHRPRAAVGEAAVGEAAQLMRQDDRAVAAVAAAPPSQPQGGLAEEAQAVLH